jgi:excisionase family DNA binding protein
VDTYLSTKEAADLLEVDRSTLWRWVRVNKLTPSSYVGGRAVYRLAYLLERKRELRRTERKTTNVA